MPVLTSTSAVATSTYGLDLVYTAAPKQEQQKNLFANTLKKAIRSVVQVSLLGDWTVLPVPPR